jgi:glycosyl transferase family 25
MDYLSVNGVTMYRVKSESWCAGAYIVTKETAKELISVRKKDWEPTDFFLYSPEHSTTFRRMKIYQAFPFLANQTKFTKSNEFESNIEKEQQPKESLLRVLRSKSIHYIPKLLLGYKRVPSFRR